MKLYLLIGVSAAALAWLSALAAAGDLGKAGKPAGTEQLREELAYAVGLQAYVYGFPVVEMYRVRYRHVSDPNNPERTPLNRLRHARRLRDHTATAVVSPNNDTLYSSAWLDLAREPVVLSLPDAGGRYFSFQLIDAYTNNFAHLGKRSSGTDQGDFAVVGPGWKGTLPEGLRRIDAPTNVVWLLGRTLADGEDDLPAVHALQDRYALVPLSAWGKKEPPPPAGEVLPPADPSDPLGFFAVLNVALRENPPPAREAALVGLLARIGVGTDQVFAAGRLDPATARGLRRAVETGRRLVAADLDAAAPVNGWRYPPREVGRFGHDYLGRATVAAGLLAALSAEEAVYPTAFTDGEGRPLHGSHRYIFRLEKGQAPPVDAFWSLTLYRLPERLFAANPLKRYAVGDRTRGLKYGADGSLEIAIQHDPPGKDREANWLPAPEGPFCLTLRGFLPRKEMRDGTWRAPPVMRVE
jgi:hypothetical protein